MEQYISRCIDSLLIKNGIDKIEILVINDGSKDRSSEIAHSYNHKYPNSIFVIDKENGNYGSCINAGLKTATGKYIKILDSDDYFNPTDFEGLIPLLERSNVDAVITNHTIITPKGKTLWKHPYHNGQIINLNESCPAYFPMHSVLYRTNFLKQFDYHQTEGISYTDQEWILYPMLKASTLQYLDLDVYQYCMDREGQTMDPSVFAKGLPMLYKILYKVLESTIFGTIESNYARKNYRDMHIFRQAEVIYRQELILNPIVSDNLKILDDKIKNSAPDIYSKMNSLSIGYHKYVKTFRKKGRGIPLLVRKTLPIQILILRLS